MADDALGLRGFAQVVPRQGNIYALSRLAEQRRQADREFQLKQQEGFAKTFDDFRKGLALEKLQPELMNAQRELYAQTYAAGSNLYKDSIKSGNYQAAKTAFSDLQANFDQFKAGLSSISESVDLLQKTINADKKGVFNPAGFGRRTNDIMSKAVIRDNGRIVGFDKEAIKELDFLLEDPAIYDKTAKIKTFIDDLADQQQSKVSDSGMYSQVDVEKFKKGTFQLEGDQIKKDKNGIPIVSVTPEFVNQFESDPILKKMAMEEAARIAPEGKKPEQYKKEAIENLISEHVPYSEDVKFRTPKPEHAFKEAEKKVNLDTAYKIVEGVVVRKDQAALEQLNRYFGEEAKLEFVTSDPENPEANAPYKNKVVLKKREKVPDVKDSDLAGLSDESEKFFFTQRAPKKYEWVVVQEYDLNDVRAAMSGLSKVLSSANPEFKNISSKLFEKIDSQIQRGEFDNY